MTTEYFGTLLPGVIVLALFILIAWFFQQLGKKAFVKTRFLSIQENVPISANERLTLQQTADNHKVEMVKGMQQHQQKLQQQKESQKAKPPKPKK